VYRFLLSPRWVAFALFALLIGGLSIRLGLWQWHRLEYRHETNARVTTLLKEQPRAVDTFSPGRDAEWTRLRATGRYLDPQTLTVKFTIRGGSPGAEVVTPLLLSDGRAVLIDRGWLSTDNNGRRPSDIPPAPRGEVVVTGWWHPDNRAGGNATHPESGQIRAISSRALARHVGATMVPGFVSLTTQSPAADGALKLAPPPDLGSGPHFFYALQWWFFAGLAIVGYVWFARAEATERRGGGSRPQLRARPDPAQ
jgi:cytochrome oxidase assembly protein ShyY1